MAERQIIAVGAREARFGGVAEHTPGRFTLQSGEEIGTDLSRKTRQVA